MGVRIRKKRPKPHTFVQTGAQKMEEHKRIERVMRLVRVSDEPKSRGLEAAVEYITPATARNWLAAKAPNRRLNQERIRRLADAILRGEWQIDGQAIKFNARG